MYQQHCRMLQVERFFRQCRKLLRHYCRFLATMSNEILSFRQSRNKLNIFNLFWLCRKDEISFDIVAVIRNKVECCFDKVERSFDNVACCFDIVVGVDWAFKHALTSGVARQVMALSSTGLLFAKIVIQYSATWLPVHLDHHQLRAQRSVTSIGLWEAFTFLSCT